MRDGVSRTREQIRQVCNQDFSHEVSGVRSAPKGTFVARRQSSRQLTLGSNFARLQYGIRSIPFPLEWPGERMNILKSLMTLGLLAISTPVVAQQSGRPQDGFYSGQSNGQYSGQVNPRVDGRGSHREGFPPSAADRLNRTFANPLNVQDCAEVDSFAPDARPGWQARVRYACQQ